jgi:hypothetical protein
MMKTHNQWLFEAPFISSEWPVYLDFEDELEGSVSAALYEGRGTLSRRQEEQIIRQAIQSGIRDENQLTNRVFSARYPKRRGRILTKSDPNYRQLSQEWLSIRNHLVLPALQSLPSKQPTLTPTTTPPLLDTESQPADKTLYVKIPLGGNSPAVSMTGIFIPSGYRVNSQVDLIVYLHGHDIRKCKKESLPCTPETISIKRYWNKAFYKHFAFREGVNASGKNVILVAPTLGPRSQEGWLTNPGGFDRYLNQVITALSTYGPYKSMQQPLTMGNIILACHSGGGRVMRLLVSLSDRAVSKVRECWGFDCLYGKAIDDSWLKWAKDNPRVTLYIHYGNGGTGISSEKLRDKLPNICIQGDFNLEHNFVPITHWKNRLQAALFLRNR